MAHSESIVSMAPSRRMPRPAAPPAAQTPPKTPRMAALDDLRHRIDTLDEQLITLLNERASIVESIGATKRRDGGPVYAGAKVEPLSLDAPLARRPMVAIPTKPFNLGSRQTAWGGAFTR